MIVITKFDLTYDAKTITDEDLKRRKLFEELDDAWPAFPPLVVGVVVGRQPDHVKTLGNIQKLVCFTN